METSSGGLSGQSRRSWPGLPQVPHLASGSSFLFGQANALCSPEPHTKQEDLSSVFTAEGHSVRLCVARVPHTKHHCSLGSLASFLPRSSPSRLSGQSFLRWPCFLQMAQVSPRDGSRSFGGGLSGSTFIFGHLNTPWSPAPQMRHPFSGASTLSGQSACLCPLFPQMWQNSLAMRSGQSAPLWSMAPQCRHAPDFLRCFSSSRLDAPSAGLASTDPPAVCVLVFLEEGSSPSLAGASPSSSPASRETTSSSFSAAAAAAAGAASPASTSASAAGPPEASASS